MDADELWKKVIDDKNLELAFNYALYDRLNNDHFYDPIEIYYVRSRKEEILEEIRKDLSNPSSYAPQNAYSYFPPKNNLCYRRMVYVPFKDLVARYAIVKVIAEIIDIDLHDQCFANRMEKEKRGKRLLEDFAETAWPDFCLWQATRLDEGYNILLRTDISAFYDSISHSYLIEAICESLGIQENSTIIQTLKKHLEISVVSYSYEDFQPKKARTTQQGITIGNTCDAFLPNVYLSELDDKLSGIEDIKYGRYNDDIRIFGNEREKVLGALQIIQEYLLERGLNLNSSKTELAVGTEEITKLQSKLMIVSGEEITGLEVVKKYQTEDGDMLEELLDVSFDELQRVFESGEELKSEKDAKAYCKFLSHRDDDNNYKLSLEDRKKEHVDVLVQIMKRWRSGTRHASWLLIETAFYSGIEGEVQDYAREKILECLRDEDVSRYGKYRILHHMTKKRGSKERRGEFRFIDDLSDGQQDQIEAHLEDLINEPAFELNLISIFTLTVFGKNFDEIYSFVDQNMRKPIGDPIKSALNLLKDEVEPADLAELEPATEPDARPGRFSA